MSHLLRAGKRQLFLDAGPETRFWAPSSRFVLLFFWIIIISGSGLSALSDVLITSPPLLGVIPFRVLYSISVFSKHFP